MILRVEYRADNGQVVSASLCENILPWSPDTQTPYRIGFMVITKDKVNVAMETLNNPTSKTFTLLPYDEKNPFTHDEHPVGTISGSGENDPYARKITDYPSRVRPAAYRAGTSSFFHNL